MSIATELFGSAVLATVGGKRVSLIEGLESAWFGARLVGRAFTVRGRAGDNLAMHRALADVLGWQDRNSGSGIFPSNAKPG